MFASVGTRQSVPALPSQAMPSGLLNGCKWKLDNLLDVARSGRMASQLRQVAR